MADIIAKRIVCLANSWKKGGRCIAGKELLKDGRPSVWVRPVSDRESEAVDQSERQYRDGSEPAVLDVVDVPLLEARPRGHQQENWLLNPEYYWTREKRVTVGDLHRLVDPVEHLWIYGSESRNGLNNRVSGTDVRCLAESLCLIEINDLVLDVYDESNSFSNAVRRRIYGGFRHGGTEYCLSVTDPVCEREYTSIGYHEIGKCFLTISLGEEFKDGFCYKLIAAVIK